MAKKHSAKKEAMHQSKKQSSSTGMVIGAIVVIVILAFFFMKAGKQAEVKQAPVQAPAPGTLQNAAVPEFDKKCTVAIGIVPGSKSVANNVVTVTFKNNGRVNMEGTYFSFESTSGNVVYKKNSDVVEPGKTIAYTVDLNQVATDIGSAVKTFVVFPIQGGKACENQRSVVINYA